MNLQATKTPRAQVPAEDDRIASAIVDAAYKIHTELGPGLLENVYETCMEHELRKRGFQVDRQIVAPVIYDNVEIETGFRLDLVANNAVIVELKAVETILPVHKAQMLTYLKLTNRRLGLLMNFNVPLIKDGITKMAL